MHTQTRKRALVYTHCQELKVSSLDTTNKVSGKIWYFSRKIECKNGGWIDLSFLYCLRAYIGGRELYDKIR